MNNGQLELDPAGAESHSTNDSSVTPPAGSDGGAGALELTRETIATMDPPSPQNAGPTIVTPVELPKRGRGRPRKDAPPTPHRAKIVPVELNKPAPAVTDLAETPAAESPEQSAELKNRSAAIMIVRSLRIVGGMLGGDEWDFERGEREELEKAAEEWSASTGFSPQSPGWAFGLAVVGYAAPRLQKPRTASRVSVLWARGKAAVKFGWSYVFGK